MVNYANYKSRLIEMTRPYPIYDREYGNEVIGYTKAGDRAVITYSDFKDNYHETVIVSGEYTGVDTLALSNKDLSLSVFIFNHIEEQDLFYINGKKVKSKIV